MKLLLIFALILGLSNCIKPVHALDVELGSRSTVTINCVEPTEYTNDQVIPSSDVGEIRLFLEGQQVAASLDCPFEADISSLVAGSYNIYLRAYSDAYNTESVNSNTDVINIFEVLVKKSPVLSLE